MSVLFRGYFARAASRGYVVCVTA